MAVAGAALAATTPCTIATTPMNNHAPPSNSNADGVISFPLLAHHHVVDRRRRELQAAGEAIDEGFGDRIPHPRRSNNNLRTTTSSVVTDNNNDDDPGHRNLAAASSAAQQQLGALYQGYGTHYIDIWVGYPAQRQTAVIDTGSSVTAFPCSECTSCGHHADDPFQENNSGAFKLTHCPLNKDDDGCIFGKCGLNGLCVIEHNFGAPGSPDASSWTAYEASDVAYAAGPHDRPVDGAAPAKDPSMDESNPLKAPEFSFPLTFGCQTDVSGYFEKQLASGVMGLDRRAQSFWGQMRASQVIHRAQFSLCFVKQPIASISGSTAGAVTLGGVDKRLHKTPMVFAQSVGEGSTASFKVKMRKMYLREGNDMSVMYDAKSKYHQLDVGEGELNGNEMFNFDSGTTDTYFIQSLSREFRKLWKEATGMEYTNEPIRVSKETDLLKFPTIILQIVPHAGGIGDEVLTTDPRTVPGLAGNVDMAMPNDVMLAITPKHYMQRNSKEETYTSRVYLDRANELGNVLGANAMMGHDILFDMDEARIGFSESECDYAKLISGGNHHGEEDGDGASAKVAGGNAQMSPSGLNGVQAEDSDDDSGICSSMKCRGLFGLSMTVFCCLFFWFARRYVTKREDPTLTRHHSSSNDFEMKSSSRSLHSGVVTASTGYSDSDLQGGERGGYRDNAPPNGEHSSSSSSRRRSGSREGERGSKRGGGGERRRSSQERGQGGGEQRHRSTSRESIDNNRSVQSIHSNKSHGSGGSGGSGGSRETRQSQRSSRSHGTHRSSRSKESHRSSGTRDSHRSRRSTGSRESHRSHRSSGSRREVEGGGSSRHSRGDQGRQQSDRNRFVDDVYEEDEIPMPPSIA